MWRTEVKKWKVKEKRQRSDYEREQKLGGSGVMERRGQSLEERDRWEGRGRRRKRRRRRKSPCF